MNTRVYSKLGNHILFVTCAAIVTVILIVGFRPLKFIYPNRVHWVEEKKGLQFIRRGIAYTDDEIVLGRDGFSVEILFEPHRKRTWGLDYILEINDGRDPSVFIVGQWNSKLILRGRNEDYESKKDFFEIIVEEFLKEGEKNYLAITVDYDGIGIFINGTFSMYFPESLLVREDVEPKGRLILGNSATGDQGWSGIVYRMSLSRKILKEEDIQKHYLNWLKDSSSDQKFLDESPYEYLFDKSQGNNVKIGNDPSGALIIPEKFKVLNKQILIPPWEEFHFRRRYFFDVVINILGFMPLGFFLTLYFYRVRQVEVKAASVLTVSGGVILSLCIEIGQVFIPVRTSSSGDLILNSLGTIVGAIFGYLLITSFKVLPRRPPPTNNDQP